MLMVVTGVLLIFTVVELRPLVKQKQWRETVTFSVLMMIASLYSIGLILNWQLPNLAKMFAQISIPLTKWIEQMLI